jgi:predicted secreted protein/Tol biopolymer transport system component
MKKTIIIALVMAMCLSAVVAKADFKFWTPTNLGPPVNTPADEGNPHTSPDGLALYFSSGQSGGSGGHDLYVSRRETPDAEWGTPVNLGSTVNSSADDWGPSLSPNGLELYFTSKRSGGHGGFSDIWLTTRATQEDDWGSPINLGSNINTSDFEGHPSISSDGLELYFCAWTTNTRPGSGSSDIWVTSRPSLSDPWAEPVNLGAPVNSSAFEGEQDITADGLCLVFSGDRPGGSGGWDLWITTRKTKEDPWGYPVNLGPEVNSSGTDAMADISDDGSVLLFSSDRSAEQGVFDIWQVPIIPIVDLNGDGIVDAADMCIIVDNWGTDNKLCDIGPMPWGDGTVDVQDLIVLAEHLFEVYPSAETVDVNEADDGGQIELELGKLLVVTLESNPSTGYRWELVENNNFVLKQFGETEFKSSDTSEPPLVGAGGWEIFRFKAVSAGQTTLELIYHRPWEDVEPLKTFSIQVTVN